jgi:hypothetical protein
MSTPTTESPGRGTSPPPRAVGLHLWTASWRTRCPVTLLELAPGGIN